MSYTFVNIPTEPEKKKVLPDEQVLLADQNSKRTEAQLRTAGFPVIALLFFIGALSFAVALSYNTMMGKVLEMYSFGDGFKGAIINFFVLITVTMLVVWLAWKKYPAIVESKII